MFKINKQKFTTIEINQRMDKVENTVYEFLKPYGFKKYGRTLHRFVSNDISQVVAFQRESSYLDRSNFFVVTLGIRVPECSPTVRKKKYYHEYECNIRSRLGVIKKKSPSEYNLKKNVEKITNDIICQLKELVLPVFDELNSREAILKKRREYSSFDQVHYHPLLIEEVMMYVYLKDMDKAKTLFNLHYKSVDLKKSKMNYHHLKYLHELADKLGIEIDEPKKL